MKKTFCSLLLFLFLTSFFIFPEVLIISNPDNKISTLKNKDIKDIFTGKRTLWNGHGQIIIATLYDSEVHRKFLEKFVQKTPSQFKNYWRQKVFTGEGMLPKTFKDEESLIEFIASTRGAVGYISSPPHKPVKIMHISDK
jgi:ABC-type phosphate transport system substrate-binding protein